MTLSFRLSDLYLVRKETLAEALLHVGMLIAFLGSMSPWFMMPIANFFPLLAALFIVPAVMVSNTIEEPVQPLFRRQDFLLPLMAFFAFSAYENFSTGRNINAYLMLTFKGAVIYGLLRLDASRLFRLSTFIAKVMGALLAISLAGFFLFMLGFPLPSTTVQLGEFYQFTNYYLFMTDDRDMFSLIHRFQSYFPEPSHVGSACAFLLFAQRGHWKKWYNIVLLTTIFFSFSLAAYVYLTAIIFLNLWINRKAMMRKLAVMLVIFAAGITTAFFYNNGDNLVHDLILLRLEVEDGEMAGDNRVTDNFERDFDNYLKSSDIVFGRSFDRTIEFGNSGYKVFFYDHGIMGILLIFSFYFLAIRGSANRRAIVSVLIIAGLYFIVSAFMTTEKVILTLYAAAYKDGLQPVSTTEEGVTQ